MQTSTKNALIGICFVLVASVIWYLAAPLFINSVVDEQFPAPATEMSSSEKEMMMEIQSLTAEQVQAMPEAERIKARATMEELAKNMPDTVMNEPASEQPTVLASGTFRDADSFHKGSGTASVYALADGSAVLRFENFSVTNGPALNVYLVKSADGNVSSGFLDLGTLKGNKGNQNYVLPKGIDASSYHSVVIWCVAFNVTFSIATLQ